MYDKGMSLLKSIIRQCTYCKKPVIINGDNRDFIFEKKGFIHTNCLYKSKKNLKRGKWTDQQCDLYIQDLYEETNVQVSEILKRNTTIERSSEEKTAHKKQLNVFYEFLTAEYSISTFTKQFFTKIASIENGTYKQITKPIPVTDLLDMWQRKISYLNKVAINNQKKGKDLIGINRANYDLAILLSKYDSYLAWKESQAIEKKDIEQKILDSKKKIDYQSISFKQPTPKNENDLDSIIDEI